jgi:hypothetical protein
VHVTACRVQLGHFGNFFFGPSKFVCFARAHLIKPPVTVGSRMRPLVFCAEFVSRCASRRSGDTRFEGVEFWSWHVLIVSHPLLERKQKWVGGRHLFFGVAGIFSPMRWQTG